MSAKPSLIDLGRSTFQLIERSFQSAQRMPLGSTTWELLAMDLRQAADQAALIAEIFQGNERKKAGQS